MPNVNTSAESTFLIDSTNTPDGTIEWNQIELDPEPKEQTPPGYEWRSLSLQEWEEKHEQRKERLDAPFNKFQADELRKRIDAERRIYSKQRDKLAALSLKEVESWLFGQAIKMKSTGANATQILVELDTIQMLILPPDYFGDKANNPETDPIGKLATAAANYYAEKKDPYWYGLSEIEWFAQIFEDTDSYGYLDISNDLIDTKKLGKMTYHTLARVGLAIRKAIITNEGNAPHKWISSTAHVKDRRTIRAAIDVLEYLQFIHEIEPYVFYRPNDSRNHCAKYRIGTLGTQRAWDEYHNGGKVLNLKPPLVDFLLPIITHEPVKTQ